MTVQDLDRLISRTELTPSSKAALKSVRRAVMSGTCGNAEIGVGRWSIAIDSDAGRQVKMTFSFRRG